jgi:hypothetical protein
MTYRDGTEVRVGDVVAVNQGGSVERGVVERVILPATQDAIDWSLPTGGVLIRGGGLGVFTTASLEQDEDIDFVSRKISPPKRSGAG